MAYEIHIKRSHIDGPGRPITLEEWIDAVSRVEGVRIASGDVQIINEHTGDCISFRNNGGDAEMFLSSVQGWQRVFYWRRSGRISFRAFPDFHETTCQVRRIALALSRVLDARVVGDEGEVYG